MNDFGCTNGFSPWLLSPCHTLEMFGRLRRRIFFSSFSSIIRPCFTTCRQRTCGCSKCFDIYIHIYIFWVPLQRCPLMCTMGITASEKWLVVDRISVSNTYFLFLSFQAANFRFAVLIDISKQMIYFCDYWPKLNVSRSRALPIHDEAQQLCMRMNRTTAKARVLSISERLSF